LVSTKTHALVPSSKGENTLTLGLGFPFIHGSVQAFYPINQTYGVGIGASDLLTLVDTGSIYAHVRFFNKSLLSASIFLEKSTAESGGWDGSTQTHTALGIGLTAQTPFGELSAHMRKRNSDDDAFGVISGLEMRRDTDFFIGSLFEAPWLVYFGWKIPLVMPSLDLDPL